MKNDGEREMTITENKRQKELDQVRSSLATLQNKGVPICNELKEAIGHD